VHRILNSKRDRLRHLKLQNQERQRKGENSGTWIILNGWLGRLGLFVGVALGALGGWYVVWIELGLSWELGGCLVFVDVRGTEGRVFGFWVLIWEEF